MKLSDIVDNKRKTIISTLEAFGIDCSDIDEQVDRGMTPYNCVYEPHWDKIKPWAHVLAVYSVELHDPSGLIHSCFTEHFSAYHMAILYDRMFINKKRSGVAENTVDEFFGLTSLFHPSDHTYDKEVKKFKQSVGNSTNNKRFILIQDQEAISFIAFYTKYTEAL